jgi:hypothetical protein
MGEREHNLMEEGESQAYQRTSAQSWKDTSIQRPILNDANDESESTRPETSLVLCCPAPIRDLTVALEVCVRLAGAGRS